jgi:hypothetical protein
MREHQAAMDTKLCYVPPPASKAWAMRQQRSHLQTDIALAGSRYRTSQEPTCSTSRRPGHKKTVEHFPERPKLGQTTVVRSDIATVP